jgi:hypothetical protein
LTKNIFPWKCMGGAKRIYLPVLIMCNTIDIALYVYAP